LEANVKCIKGAEQRYSVLESLPINLTKEVNGSVHATSKPHIELGAA